MRTGHKARLLTSDLRGSSSPQCLVFYFHMYGSGSGILSVLLREGGGRWDSLLWRRRGEQGIGWMRAAVDYRCDVRHQARKPNYQRGLDSTPPRRCGSRPMCLVCVQIVFEAIRGPSLRSDIAIDDVSFKRGPCEGEREQGGQSSGSTSVTSASSPLRSRRRRSVLGL